MTPSAPWVAELDEHCVFAVIRAAGSGADYIDGTLY
jgi:hypothetical protein